MRILLILLCLSDLLTAQADTQFEAPQARPILVSPDGSRLLVLNTPDHSLAVFSLADPARPLLLQEIEVGLGPVSLAMRSRSEVWVLCHVSDAVTVVDLDRGRVLAQISVGDEPGDLVFAGQPQRAFVSTMTGRRLQVFDPQSRRLLKEIPVLGEDPRAMLVSADGKSLWLAAHRSGNKTTILPHRLAPPSPKPTNPQLPPAPQQGLIVRSDDPRWSSSHKLRLPDFDLFEIDVPGLSLRRSYAGLGTILFQMAQHPGTGEIWICNTEARNQVRFEPALRGHAIDSRITRLQPGPQAKMQVVDLNPGLNYSLLPNPAARARALSQPTDLVFAPGGKEAYLAAFGSDRIAVLDAQARVLARIELAASPASVDPRRMRGPRGLAHHPSQGLLYVLNRLRSSVAVVDTQARALRHEVDLFDPTPPQIKAGRGFLYDARLSGNGTMSCASCHIDGRHDGLAWDLGDPGGQMFSIGTSRALHPMKGPLLTQTLQGMGTERDFHWRADRPGLGTFNAAFDTLMGGRRLAVAELADFVAYMKSLRFMPNPQLQLDGSLPPGPQGAAAQDGARIFHQLDDVGRNGSNSFRCVDCHFRGSGSGSVGFDGLFGQQAKAAQLRGLYRRLGRVPTSQGSSAGFGLGADGAHDDVLAWLGQTRRFNPLSRLQQEALQRYLLAYPTGMAPGVGYARLLRSGSLSQAPIAGELAVLLAAADRGEVDLVMNGEVQGLALGLVYERGRRRFQRGVAGALAVDVATLPAILALPDSWLLLRGVPPGLGRRLGIDRDGDGVLDGDEGRRPRGLPSPGCDSGLRLQANRDPRLPTPDFALVIRGAAGRGQGFVLVGGPANGLALADLRLFVAPSGSQLLPLRAGPDGVAVLPLALPNNPALKGLGAHLQAAFASSCGQLGYALSPGLHLRIPR